MICQFTLENNGPTRTFSLLSTYLMRDSPRTQTVTRKDPARPTICRVFLCARGLPDTPETGPVLPPSLAFYQSTCLSGTSPPLQLYAMPNIPLLRAGWVFLGVEIFALSSRAPAQDNMNTKRKGQTRLQRSCHRPPSTEANSDP